MEKLGKVGLGDDEYIRQQNHIRDKINEIVDWITEQGNDLICNGACKCPDCRVLADASPVSSNRDSTIKFKKALKNGSIEVGVNEDAPGDNWKEEFEEKFTNGAGYFGWQDIYPLDVTEFIESLLRQVINEIPEMLPDSKDLSQTLKASLLKKYL